MKNLTISLYPRNEASRLKEGKAPIFIQLKCNGTKTNFPANVYVDVERWNHTNKFTEKKRTTDELDIREYLNDLTKQLNKIEEGFIEAGTSYTAEMIKNRILAKDAESISKQKTVDDAFLLHETHFKDQCKKGELKLNSYKKYRSMKFYLDKFIKEKHNQTSFLLENLNNDFQKQFHTFLSSQSKLTKKNTVIKYLVLFRSVIQLVVNEGWLKEYPFINYELKREKTKNPDVLTLAEIQTIMLKDYRDSKLNKIKDYFLFQVMTGLAYCDMIALEEQDIITIGDKQIISTERMKTGVTATVLLQPQAIEILERWKGKNEKHPERCFPYISNKEYNVFLKDIASMVDIKKNITSHLARHTFGCLMVQSGIDFKAIQLAMGHSRLQQTEHYAKMFAPQVINEQSKMNDLFNPSKKYLKRT